jgi:hypothetical protein
MKKLSSLTIIAVVLTAVTAFDQTSVKPAAGKTLTGVVSDSMCGAKHMAKDKSAADCTRECVKSGSDYALVVGDKIYPLKGDKAELDKYAGQGATVKGTLDGNNINVQSIHWCKEGCYGWKDGFRSHEDGRHERHGRTGKTTNPEISGSKAVQG